MDFIIVHLFLIRTDRHNTSSKTGTLRSLFLVISWGIFILKFTSWFVTEMENWVNKQRKEKCLSLCWDSFSRCWMFKCIYISLSWALDLAQEVSHFPLMLNPFSWSIYFLHFFHMRKKITYLDLGAVIRNKSFEILL